MTNYYYKTPTVTHRDPKQFSGVLYASDFDTERGKDENDGSPIAKRIFSDFRFDEQCKKDILAKYRSKEYMERRTN